MAAQNDLIGVAIDEQGRYHAVFFVSVFINLKILCSSLVSPNNFWRQWGKDLLGKCERTYLAKCERAYYWAMG